MNDPNNHTDRPPVCDYEGSDYQTSFWYQRVYLIGDTRVMSSLTLSVLFSAEWEWHEFKQDNSELYLLSSLLSYSF